MKKRGVGDLDSWRTSDGGMTKSLSEGGILISWIYYGNLSSSNSQDCCPVNIQDSDTVSDGRY